MDNNQLAFLRCKCVGGSIGAKNLIATTKYYYDKDTFEYSHMNHLYDGGDEAIKEGYYTFESVRSFIESKGITELIRVTNGNLS